MNQKFSTVDELLEELKRLGIKLWSDRGELRYRAPKGALNAALKQELKKHKAAILTSLTPENRSSQLDLAGFFAQPTLAQLHQVVNNPSLTKASNSIGQTATTMELASEATSVLELNLDLTLERSLGKPAAILLTGSTGFLGVYLLHELLVQTQADIYCLIRADDLETASKRLQQQLKEHQLWQDSFSLRIMPLVGDLAQPQLGLSLSQYEQLCQTIDVIYHNGALVNFLYPYAAFKAPNVLGTQEIIKIASKSKIKPLHYISTVAVFLSVNSGDRIFSESDSIDTGITIQGGYGQSKWVAEKLVTHARQKGLPVTIYRPGSITGHSTTGISGTQDLLSLMLRSCLEIGVMAEVNTELSLTPVDYISRAIVCLSQQQNTNHTNNKSYHLVSPHDYPWNKLPDLMTSLGYPVKQVPFEQWCEEISRTEGQSATDSLKPLLPLLIKSHSAGNIKFDSQNAIRELAQQGIEFPDSFPQLLNCQLAYFSGSKCLSKG